MKDFLKDVEDKFVNGFMMTTQQRESQVESYLKRLQRERPEEGKYVKGALVQLAVELLGLTNPHHVARVYAEQVGAECIVALGVRGAREHAE